MIILFDTHACYRASSDPTVSPPESCDLLQRECFGWRTMNAFSQNTARCWGAPNSPSPPSRPFLDQIEAEGVAVAAVPLRFPLPDPDDAPFLEVAAAARADAPITGNTRHYPARARHGITVLDPSAFLNRWTRQQQR